MSFGCCSAKVVATTLCDPQNQFYIMNFANRGEYGPSFARKQFNFLHVHDTKVTE